MAHAISNVQLKDWLQYFETMLDKNDPRYQDEVHSLGSMIFDVCDMDDSGPLDRNEWFALFKAYNLPVVYADESFAKLDKNRMACCRRMKLFMPSRTLLQRRSRRVGQLYVWPLLRG